MPDVLEDKAVKKTWQGRRPRSLDVRSLIKNTVVAYYKPDEIRDMISRDVFLIFDGWNEANSPKKAGSDAPSLEEAKELARRNG